MPAARAASAMNFARGPTVKSTSASILRQNAPPLVRLRRIFADLEHIAQHRDLALAGEHIERLERERMAIKLAL